MKKTLALALVAFASIALLDACSKNTPAADNMQKPQTPATSQTSTQQDLPAANENNDTDDDESEEEESNLGTAAATAPTTAPSTTPPADGKTLNNQNMLDAVRGEFTASAKYAAYAKKAEAEGYHEIALLFKAASRAELIHANNHTAVLEEAGQRIPPFTPSFTVKSTKENLDDAIASEGYESTTMYPEFLKNANAAGNQLSLMSLNYAYKTEKKHKPLYEKALLALQNNTVKTLPKSYLICQTCGNTYESTSPKRCGISMTGADKFITISGRV